MKRASEHQGFTLVEVILAVAIASAVTLSVFSGFQLIDGMRLRQERAGVVVWEGDLILHRIRELMVRGVSLPAAQTTAVTLEFADGSELAEESGRFLLTEPGRTVPLSSEDVRISSVSFSDVGTEQYPGLIRVDFTVSSTASDSRSSYEQRYLTTFYER